MSRSAGAAAALVCALVTMSASAVTPEDRAAADQLFKDGRALVKGGNYAQACPMLASSNALDPTPGTMLALGDCYELNGQTASAWATFSDAVAAARSAGDQKRLDEATRRRDALEPRLSKLLLELSPEDRGAPGLEAKRNGKPIPTPMIGVPFPVDPGTQTVEVSAPGRQVWLGEAVVNAPGVSKISVPKLAPGGAPQPPAGATPARDTSRGNGQRIAGVVVGSVGVAGLVVGAVFGGLAIATVGDIHDRGLCDPTTPVRCSQEGLDLQDDANAQANVANIALPIGGAAVVTGIVLFVTAPRAKPGPPPTKPAAAFDVSPIVGPSVGGLIVRGSFF
ncbi:MAG: hypothetical protein U0414_11975 [Polyangiaceae bacterium]